MADVTKQLIRDSDWNSEVAARAYLDGQYQGALQAADRAVKLTNRILRRTPDDAEVIDALVDRYKWRALIHQALGNHTTAIDDAEAAITLIARLAGQSPLRIPALRLLQCELHATLGNATAARLAGQAAEAFRQQAREETVDPLAVAEALSRYAVAMATIGDVEAARPARDEAVHAYRNGLDRIYQESERIWFATAVEEMAAEAEPPNAAGAPELLPLLHDAAQQWTALITASPLTFRSPRARDYGAAALRLLATEAQWLDALGARRTAAVFEEASQDLLHVPVQRWPNRLFALQDLLEQTLAAGTDPAS